ncbi:MAG: sugar ABC transporter permease YjfF [Chthonomonadales bacterium]|nr:sugar ABC transporter permease YjfF [Chthonomonadales bacterium]
MRPSRTQLPLLTTAAVLALLYAAGAARYPAFLSWGVAVNLLRDNAFLGLASIGMTFVILTGGIDLSVGAMVGFSSILVAVLVQRHHVHPLPAFAVAGAAGTALGAGMGALIRWFALPPFLVTLAGMFLARGLGFVVSMESISIEHPFHSVLTGLGATTLPLPAAALLVGFAAAIYLAHWTRFGRNVYAVGGSEPSAILMGLPVGATKVLVYALSGLCAALAGVVYTIYTSSGSATAGTTLELDAIASVAIGGTLLTGGVGYPLGTLLGVLILGIIQTLIAFEGTLSSWWTRIAVGGLVLVFVLLQRLLHSRASRGEIAA